MQQLAFDVLSSTKDLPFKLPSDAVYILRVSAIIEGLGTTYIENFNGIKDILPTLQENIPKALGAKTFSELLTQGIKDTPFVLQNMQSSFQKIAEDDVGVKLSDDQLGWAAKEIKEYLKGLLGGALFIVAGFFTLLYDRELKELALILFLLGALRIYFKR